MMGNKKFLAAESRCENYVRGQLLLLGWKTERPGPGGGEVAEKQELRNDPRLRQLMQRGAPEFVLYVDDTPAVAIECKARKEDIEAACQEAQDYARTLKFRIAIGVAGNERDGVIVRNFYRKNGKYDVVTYRGSPLTQILSKAYVQRLIKSNKPEIDIDIPTEERFWEEANTIHNLLRNSDIPKQRMAAYLGTIILAFSENSQILAEKDFTDLAVLNTLAQTKLGKYNKPDLKKIFQIPDPTSDVFKNLKRNLPLIINALQRLDVLPLLQTGVDILRKFFEQFLRYANDKKELGIVFTPRHIVDFMVAISEIQLADKILDPCCGTGGFLVSAFNAMRSQLDRKKSLSEAERAAELKKIKQERIYGFESESDGVIYGLACLNMIFRGDGNTNIKHSDCFNKQMTKEFDRVLINPPYSQSKKGTNGVHETKYLDYCLQSLKEGGTLCAIIPYSIMSDGSKWRRSLLKQHTLIACISVPALLFYPISAPAIIVLFRAHMPHGKRPVFFGRIEDDGFEIDRQKRSKTREGQQTKLLKLFFQWKALYDKGIFEVDFDILQFLKVKAIDEEEVNVELVPEAYLNKKPYMKEEIEGGVDFVLREQLCFQLKYSQRLLDSGRNTVNDGNTQSLLKKLTLKKAEKEKIAHLSDFFEERRSKGETVYCEYGQKELHDKSWLQPGNDIIVAAGGVEKGLYGFHKFPPYYKKPVVTSPSSGSICEAYVQEFPCSAYDNTLVLIPKPSIDLEILYYVSAFIRLEAWRYRYGRQITPTRLDNLEIDLTYYDKAAIANFRKSFPFSLNP